MFFIFIVLNFQKKMKYIVVIILSEIVFIKIILVG
jgi:hypothetical protein